MLIDALKLTSTGVDFDQCAVGLNLASFPEAAQFVAREKELSKIHELLHGHSSRSCVVLHGLGGIGKTQLTIEYIRRHKEKYTAIFWLNANDQDSLKLSFRDVAQQELRDASRRGTPAQDLEFWEQRETDVLMERGAVAMQQQEELAAQKEELGQSAVGDQQDLVEVVDADDPEDKKATEALPTAQLKIPVIDQHRFRLRRVRARQLARRQTKTTQHRVV